MKETIPSSPRRRTTQNVVPFERLDTESNDIQVSLVMVPPHKDGKGWGHTDSGACVEFSQARETMLQLYHRLRVAGRQTPVDVVKIDGSKWDVEAIDRADCPIHALPEIVEGSAVAFAPY